MPGFNWLVEFPDLIDLIFKSLGSCFLGEVARLFNPDIRDEPFS
jgi:hypothetical protein